VPITDGRKARGVKINTVAEALKSLEQIEPGRAESHSKWQEGSRLLGCLHCWIHNPTLAKIAK
jgi:hypothetical protein